MKKGILFVESKYFKNKIFCEKNNQKNHFKYSKYIELKKEFERNKISLCTQDIYSFKEADFVIYLDFKKRPQGKNNYLIVREPPAIIPENHDLDKLKIYNKIFTFNDDLVDNINIHKYYNGSYNFDLVKPKKNFSTSGYCLICSNKKSNHIKENYSMRYSLIDFFEKNNLKFDLYGIGFHKKAYANKYLEFFLRNVPVLRPYENLKNYKGVVKNKREIASHYLFQFAIENSKNINGYISEKIFDSFFSDNIPVYSGSSNVKKYIPSETFIDLKAYDSIESLIEFTENLNQVSILNFKKAKEDFLNSEGVKIFDSETNSKNLVNIVLEDLI